MQVEEKGSRPPITASEQASEPLTPLPPDAGQQAGDEDSPDAIFLRAVSEIPTQPLPAYRPREEEVVERYFIFTVFLVVCCLLVSSIAAIINQPVVTVTLFPIHKSVQLTTTIALVTRTFTPVTLTRTLTAPTTGKGHQDARTAAGTLTFYNGLATSQRIQAGTVFTGNDGVKIASVAPVTIPAANAPSWGVATVSASAISAGRRGNIPLLDINTTVTSSLFVKNLAAFTGGQDARDFRAVAKHDLDTLTAQLQEQLTRAMTQAFTRRPGEAVQTTDCMFKSSPDYQPGDEAQTVTTKASQTCGAIAYNQDELARRATVAFSATRPGREFEVVSSVQTTVVRITPFIVRVSGQWEYAITPDDEQDLAQHIQEETPARARAYLLKTGFVSRVTIRQTQTLPDCYHIKFLILIGV